MVSIDNCFIDDFDRLVFQTLTDNLEVGNNRKALQESEKLLRKHPNLLCARALKVNGEPICIPNENIQSDAIYHYL